MAPLFLTACEQDRIQTICETTPQFCADLHEDSWCKFERSDLIRARKQQADTPNDANIYALMASLKTYHDCLDPLLAIEYTKRKERKNDKLEATIKAKTALIQLEQQTIDSDYPYLLLWHWQLRGDNKAKARFISLADRTEMQQPELQKALAELLIIRDSAAAEQALHRALSLYDAEATVDSEIIANLLTLYIRERRYRDAWIWTRVLSSLGHSAMLNLERIDPYARFDEVQQRQMQQAVDSIIHQLETGSYHRS
ncbi:DUF2989 domain-containing protein [Oceanisphaera sp. KMM 10153]|uniref:DUF2989 domain-containing protein n=1 Tax=Oceanisphaera submarina TaxID=3390193 RepID=UPI0039749A71